MKEKNRTYHKVYALPVNEAMYESYNEVSLVCLRQDGAYDAPATVSCICMAMKKRIDGFANFHFHLFRHTYTSKLLANGAAAKDVQELLWTLRHQYDIECVCSCNERIKEKFGYAT